MALEVTSRLSIDATATEKNQPVAIGGGALTLARPRQWLHSFRTGPDAYPTATYQGGSELEAIEPGSCIAITDSAVHLDEALALVVDVEATSAGALLSLVLLDNPVGQPFDV
jgi:hypothetical protein